MGPVLGISGPDIRRAGDDEHPRPFLAGPICGVVFTSMGVAGLARYCAKHEQRVVCMLCTAGPPCMHVRPFLLAESGLWMKLGLEAEDGANVNLPRSVL